MSNPFQGWNEDSGIYISTLFDEDKQPLIQFDFGRVGIHAQMTLAQADYFADSLLKAIEMARAEAFFVGFFQEKFNVNDERMTIILYNFRVWREKHPLYQKEI